MFKKPVTDLVKLSQILGKDLFLTQASGGNTSIKMDGEQMIIKQSGGWLGEMTETIGWGVAHHAQLAEEIKSLTPLEETSYAELVQKCTVSPHLKISLESGLHALLPNPCVAHVHSVAGQFLGLLPEKERASVLETVVTKETHVLVAPPTVPGFELTQSVERLSFKKNRPHLVILENHGLAWGGESVDELLMRIHSFEKILRERFGLKDFFPPSVESTENENWHRVHFPSWPRCEFDTRPLIGDFVGHFDTSNFIQESPRSALIKESSPRLLEGHAQVLFAHAVVSTLAQEHRCFRPLPPRIIHTIREQELYKPKNGS